jgi:hypothetical protein
MCHYAIKAANAIEYIFVLALSPREESTQGTFAPFSKAPSSAWLNLVQHL